MRTSLTFFQLIFFLLFLSSVSAQYIVKGLVIDNSGHPLIGVSIIEKGTTRGTITDFDGHFTIAVESANSKLLVSFVGYETQEVSINGQTDIQVVLSEDTTMLLEEVVVTGYGRTRKRSIFGKKKRKKNSSTAYHKPATPVIPVLDSESYSEISENVFKKVTSEPLSTFSVDVDAASYSNVRRFINQGQRPPSDAVRIEEMINYFDYDYPQPQGNVPFSVNSELSSCPWNEDNMLLHIGLQGRTIPTNQIPASNIVFLLDVSGSMNSSNKLPLLKSSFGLLTNQLRQEDRVAIVVYAGNTGVVLESTSGVYKGEILSALENLRAGGGTSGAAGLELAYQIARENFIENGNNRIILATDGDFNIGPSSDQEMKNMIKKNREHGVSISVLGFGMGNYKDSKMETIADNGNGNYAYIDNLQEARKVLVKEFGGTLHTIAKDVKFQLEFNPYYVSEYRLIGYENRLLENEDFEDDKKDAGEIGAGHSVTALYELVLADNSVKIDNPLKYQSSTLTDEAMRDNDLITLKLRYKKPKGTKSKLVEQVVKNSLTPEESLSDNFKFSASVVSFGMLLRDSEYKGSTDWDSVIALAKSGRGKDEEGYRGEMIRLMETAKGLK